MTLEELEAAVAALADRVTAVEALDQMDVLNRLVDLEDDSEILTGRVTTIEQSTPTLEELLSSTVICCWNGASVVSSGFRMTLMTAPFPCRILGLGLSFEYTTLASGQPVVVGSNTNYWRAVLERGKPNGSFPDMAAKSTQLTGAETNGPILTRRTWSFDSANWNGDRDLNKDDLLCLNWQETGSPTPLRFPMVATVRYAPL